MQSIQLPVSFEFFKKYTYNEEIIEMMLKAKANGDPKIYECLAKNGQLKEQALKSFYEAFYMKPKIREKYNIRFKAAPKKVKDKLLVIPAVLGSDENIKNTCPVESEINNIELSGKDTGVMKKCLEEKQPALSLAKRVSGGDDEGDQVAEDDSEPLSSPDISTKAAKININMPTKMPGNSTDQQKTMKFPRDSEHKNNLTTTEMNNNSKDSAESQQTDTTEIPNTTVSQNKKQIDYKVLFQYAHCCPLTFKEFLKYTNIQQLAKELSIKRNLNENQQRLFLNHSYLLFYLIPENRSKSPINQIHLKEDSPEDIKNKFLKIPTKLYLKEDINEVREKENYEMEVVNIEATTNNMALELSKNYNEEVNEQQSKISNELPQNISETNVSRVNSSLKNHNVNMKDLTKYAHYCPLTYKEFLKYTNTKQIVQELSAQRNLNKNQQRLLLNRSYLLFYLAPEHRNIAPINKIHLAKNCPQEIKNKFLEIPTKLYLKEERNKEEFLNKTREYIINKETKDRKTIEITNKQQDEVLNKVYQTTEQVVADQINTNQEIVASITPKETPQLQVSSTEQTVSEQRNINQQIMVTIPKETFQTLTGKCSTSTEQTDTEYCNVNQQDSTNPVETNNKEISQTLATKYSTFATTDRTDSEYHEGNQQSIKISSSKDTTNPLETINPQTLASKLSALVPPTKLPVSLETFKKYSYFEEVIEKIFIQKAQSDHKLLQQYKNSAQAFNTTLNNYYYAFYLMPFIRNILPIRFKEAPIFIKDRLLQIPEAKDFQIEQLVEMDFLCKAKELKNNGTSVENATEAANNFIPTIQTEVKIAENTVADKIKPPVKRVAIQDMKTSSPKKQKIQLTQENTQISKKSYTDLLSYVHCCPITFKDFKMYTNLSDLFKGFCQKSYKSLKKLPYMMHKAYLLYYLAPENRNLVPLNKLKITKECPKHIKEKLYEIPTNLYLKETKSIEVNTQTTNDSVQQQPLQQQTSAKKESIQILENRLISPGVLTQQNLSHPCNMESDVIGLETNKQHQMDKSSLSQTTDNSTKSCQNVTIDLWKSLNTDKTFNIFRLKLLTKLKQSFVKEIDISADTYKIFIQCNEIPLEQLLNDFCNNNEEIVQRILNDKEIYEALQHYYYSKYLTNKNFALKYPVKLKETTQQFEIEDNENVELNKEEVNKRNTLTPNKFKAQQENVHGKTPNTRNMIEKAKRIFFRNVERTNTLSYVLRTSHGLKQLVLQTVLSLTYKEFLELTNIYQGFQLYDEDDHIKECMYRYVFRSPLVWPTNLYITLKNLCDFLHSKNIRFENYATMLQYISPKILHWSCLLSCTNIMDCVKIDYENRTGKLLTLNESLRSVCSDYYNRCWKQEKWLGDVPKVNEEFYREYLVEGNNENADVTMLDTTGLKEICIESNDNEAVADEPGVATSTGEGICQQDFPVSQKNTNTVTEEENNCAASSFSEFNCVIFPNTQQQIEILPLEVKITNDPLNNSNIVTNNLNITHLTKQEKSNEGDDDNDVIVMDDIVKTEPVDEKLLSNLLFYENDNNDIECISWEAEIIDLDASNGENVDNLPDFEDITMENSQNENNRKAKTIKNVFEMQIDNKEMIVEVFMENSEECSDGIINLAQRLPSSNEGSLNSQQFMQQQQNLPITSTQLVKLPDVTLRSSGENEENQEYKENRADKLQEVENVRGNEMPQDLGTLQGLPATSLSSMQSFIACAPAQHFPSTFEDFPSSSCGSLTKVQNNQIKDSNNVVFSCQVATSLSNTFEEFQILSGASIAEVESRQVEENNENLTKEVYVSSAVALKDLPVRRGITKSTTTARNNKNVAKVRPLKNSDYVPQIQHNTRPLLTQPIYVTNKNQEVTTQQTATCSTTTLQQISVNATSNQQQITPNTSLHLQLSPSGSRIFISQELNKNCSVFNNSSLLRLVDKNYNESESSAPIKEEEELTKDTETRQTYQEQQNQATACQVPQTNTSISQHNVITSLVIEEPPTQPVPVAIGRTRRTSLCQDTNNKVNTIPLNQTNIATIQPIIHKPNKTMYRLFLYRDLLKFHYFKNLTPKHFSEYLLPSVEFGKSYTEATIQCEQFKTRLTNRSISSIFSFWTPELQKDFLLILNDLKEFHYLAYDRSTMQKKEDLRARVLFWLLSTAPFFSLCRLTYESNNTEFAYCESITNANNPSYSRKPYKCLTNALNANVLNRLRELKRDLKEGNGGSNEE